MNYMLAPNTAMLEHSFMIRAFLAGGMIALIAPTIGMFLVHRRMSFMVDALAHVSLSGIALGFLLAWNPIATAVVVTMLGGLLVEYLRKGGKLEGDSALAILLYGSLGSASILLNIVKGPGIQLESLLFGSILTVQPADLWYILILGCIVAITVIKFYKQLFCLVFDEQWAATTGLPVAALNIILILLAALTVAVSLRIIGVLLVGSLMTIPVISASALRRGFLTTLFISIAISIFSVGAGITLSYHISWPSGGTIVVVMLVVAALLNIVGRFTNSR
jgi:zinc transport system permease protein